MHYGVLVGVSTGYPPVAGRLHTRYAPVRRSPAAHCWAPLPLDLHVLSLPLAFILSQDQTLHCKNCLFVFTFDSSRVPKPRPSRSFPRTHAISSSHSFNVLSLPESGPSQGRAPLSKAGAKIQPFSETPKFFFTFFFCKFCSGCITACWKPNFFSPIPSTGLRGSRKTARKFLFPRKIRGLTDGFPQTFAACRFVSITYVLFLFDGCFPIKLCDRSLEPVWNKCAPDGERTVRGRIEL